MSIIRVLWVVVAVSQHYFKTIDASDLKEIAITCQTYIPSNPRFIAGLYTFLG